MKHVPRHSPYATMLRANRAPSGLRDAAQAVGLQFGFAWNGAALSSTSLAQKIVEQESSVSTDTGRQLWINTEATQNVFSSATGRNLVTWSTTNGIPLVGGGHLIWHDSLPAWVSGITGASNMQSVIETHIAGVMGLFPEVRNWNVVNEMMHASDLISGGYRSSVFYQELGADYIEIALRKAREVDPTAVLILNHDHLEESLADSLTEQTDFLALVTALVGDGVPLDGIGTQMHLRPTDVRTGAQVSAYLGQFEDLGLDIYITELDCWDQSNSQFSIATREADIYTMVYDIVGACCRDLERLKHIVCWSVTDADSWMITSGGTRSDGYIGRWSPYANNGAHTPFVKALRDSFALRGA